MIKDNDEDINKIGLPLAPNTLLRQQVFTHLFDMIENIFDQRTYCPAFISHAIKPEERQQPLKIITPISLPDALDRLQRCVFSGGLVQGAAGHMGYIPASTVFLGVIAATLTAAYNKNAGLGNTSAPGVKALESEVTAWLGSIVGYTSPVARYTSGGSMSNLAAVLAVRERQKQDKRRATIYCAASAHHSLIKALAVAGIDWLIRYIPCDKEACMDTDYLARQLQEDVEEGFTPALIWTSMGTTDFGSIDPIDTITPLAERYNAWLHVDAAYGGFFLLTDHSPLHAKIKSLHLVDSITFDAHKSLYAPIGCSIILFKKALSFIAVPEYDSTPDYLIGSSIDITDPLTPELTTPWRALTLWLYLQVHGAAAFGAALQEKIDLAHHLYRQFLDNPQFDVGPLPELSVVTFCYKTDSDTFNIRLLSALQESGQHYISSTRYEGRMMLRAAILAENTGKNDIDNFYQQVITLSTKLLEIDA